MNLMFQIYDRQAQRNLVSSNTRCEFRWYELSVLTGSWSALCMWTHAEGIENLTNSRICTILSLFWHRTIHESKDHTWSRVRSKLSMPDHCIEMIMLNLTCTTEMELHGSRSSDPSRIPHALCKNEIRNNWVVRKSPSSNTRAKISTT